MGETHFDLWQFYRHHSRTVSAETGLGWDDMERIGPIGPANGVEAGKLRWVPKFAFDDQQLRTVICRVGLYYNNYWHITPDWATVDWKRIDRDCTRAIMRRSSRGMPKYQKATVDQQQRAVRKAGSYLALYIGVAYHYWRRGLDCVTVAELLAMNPPQVRKYAATMVRHARALGFETFEHHKTAGRKYHGAALRHRTIARRKSLGQAR